MVVDPRNRLLAPLPAAAAGGGGDSRLDPRRVRAGSTAGCTARRSTRRGRPRTRRSDCSPARSTATAGGRSTPRATIMDPPRFLATFNQPPAEDPDRPARRDQRPGAGPGAAERPVRHRSGGRVGASAWQWARRPPSPTASAKCSKRPSGRTPTASEVERWAGLADDVAAEHGIRAGEVLKSSAVWKELAHTLYNSKEFLYVR